MAITKETEIAKIEVVNQWDVQVRVDTIIKEDNSKILQELNKIKEDVNKSTN